MACCIFAFSASCIGALVRELLYFLCEDAVNHVVQSGKCGTVQSCNTRLDDCASKPNVGYTDKMSNDIIANDKTASDKMSKDKTANDKMSNATKQLKTKCLMRQND